MRGVSGAFVAVVGHPLDILACCSIGFGGHDSTVGPLGHSCCVWKLNPFNGIEIGCKVPFMDLFWVDPIHHGKKAGDHEALNVVGVAEFECLVNGL